VVLTNQKAREKRSRYVDCRFSLNVKVFFLSRRGAENPFTGEFEVVIMIEGVTEEMHGYRTEFLT